MESNIRHLCRQLPTSVSMTLGLNIFQTILIDFFRKNGYKTFAMFVFENMT